jgi:hypothetical protein
MAGQNIKKEKKIIGTKEPLPRRVPGSPHVWREISELRKPTCMQVLLESNHAIIFLVPRLYEYWRRDPVFNKSSLFQQHYLTATFVKRICTLGTDDIDHRPFQHWASIGDSCSHYLMHALHDNGHVEHDDCTMASSSLSSHAHSFQAMLTLMRSLCLWLTDATWSTDVGWNICVI